MQFYIASSFERSLKRLEPNRKERIKKAIRLAVAFFETGQLPQGLGLKPLSQPFWEIRAGISERIIFRKHKDCIEFLLAGSHDEVKRFLKSMK